MHAILNFDTFQAFLELVKVVAFTDVPIIFNKEGLLVIQRDPANVEIVRALIPRSEFKEYNFPEGASVYIDIDLFLTATTKMKGDICRIEEDEGNLSLKVGPTKYSQPKLAANPVRKPSKDIDLPTYPVTVTMPGAELAAANKAFELIQDKMKSAEISFFIKDDSLVGRVRESKEERGKEVVHEFQADVLATEDIDSSSFDLNYIVETAKPLKGAKSLKLQFKNDYPLIISSVMDGVEVRYLLAPRVGDDVS
jgi:DNA polymerase III sliding clamp (beta) subunit (PCNA family)